MPFSLHLSSAVHCWYLVLSCVSRYVQVAQTVLRLDLTLYILTVFRLFLTADPMEELNDSTAQTATNSAADLLKQGAGNTLRSRSRLQSLSIEEVTMNL